MKQILIVFFLAILTVAEAQSPNKISYQAVIRNSSNELVSNQSIGIQISILSGSPSGTVVYSEIHTKTTSASGLISIEIGTGSSSDDFSSINWEEGPFYLKTETDPFGGSEYEITGTTQLLSVPYSIYANKAGSFDETDPVFESSISKGISESDTTNWNNKLSSYSETDPLFESSVSNGITESDTANWNNKLSSYTETDPVFESSVSKGITGSDTTNWNNKLESEEQSLENVLSFGSSANSQIKNLTDPTEDRDAATKAYVDILEKRLFQLEFSIGNDSISDIEGNYYKVVKIGNQYWFAENLKSTKYNDGKDIPVEANASNWSNLETSAYCWYNNDEISYKNLYGALYNWYAVETGKLCPNGWHVPTEDDWSRLETLTTSSGINSTDSYVLRTTSGWVTNTGTDEYGFAALPGGRRIDINGAFDLVGSYAHWWSSTESEPERAYYRVIATIFADMDLNGSRKGTGYCVRCVKNE